MILSSISTHFRTHQHTYAKCAATASTAYLVNRLWGKYAALSLIAAVVVTLPILCHQIEILKYFDLSARSQVITAALIPASYFFIPIFVPVLGSLLALSTLIREWKLAKVAEATQKEIDKMREQNQTLEKQCQESQALAQKLQQELDLCLKITTEIEQIFSTHQRADGQLEKVSDKIQKIGQIYQAAATQEQLLERMKTAQIVEEDLKRITQQCSTHRQELATLTQEISLLTDQVRSAFSSIVNHDKTIESKIQQLEQLLKDLQHK